jgi:hypothetical protein
MMEEIKVKEAFKRSKIDVRIYYEFLDFLFNPCILDPPYENL